MSTPSGDFLQKFLLENIEVRGSVIKLSHSLSKALEPHDYPAAIGQLVGEAIASSIMMSATLKKPGKLSIHARGNGPISLIMAESTHLHTFRGIAQFQADFDHEASLNTLLGEAQLAITITPEQGQRYQGIVPLDGHNLAACLAYYFDQSEQLSTCFRFAYDAAQEVLCGIFLQKLPEHDGHEHSDAWDRLIALIDTVKNEELIATSTETLLYRLFHEDKLLLFDSEPVSFKCSCSRERSLASLSIIGETDTLKLLEEQAFINIDCEFCRQNYQFNREDVQKLFSLPKPH